jgi:hypothetical protein
MEEMAMITSSWLNRLVLQQLLPECWSADAGILQLN